jgi:hypothetical protein
LDPGGPVYVDRVAPSVSIDRISVADATPGLSGTIDDPTATITVVVAGRTHGAVNNGDGTWTLADNTLSALDDGTYDVVVQAVDPAGNIGIDGSVDELAVDTTAPVVTLNSLTTTESSPELSGTVDDPAAAVVVTVAGRDYLAVSSGGTWTLAAGTIAPLSQGIHEVIVTATDLVGNVGRTTGTVTVAPAGPRQLSIDVYPNRAVNQVYLSRNYTLYVVVFGTAQFNVMDLDWTTVRFGRTGTEARAVRAPLLRDMNGDGILDALYGFMTFDCGFRLGDTKGLLTGKLKDGTDARGEDSVFVSP